MAIALGIPFAFDALVIVALTLLFWLVLVLAVFGWSLVAAAEGLDRLRADEARAAREELDRLADQLAERPVLALGVTATPATGRAFNGSAEARDAWWDQERQRYIAAVHREVERQQQEAAARSPWRLAMPTIFEDRRTSDEHTEELRKYMDEGHTHWAAGLRVAAVVHQISPLTLVVTNDTQSSFRDVELRLYFPATVSAYWSASSALEQSHFPEPPKEFGDGGLDMVTLQPLLSPPREGPIAVEGDDLVVRYLPVDIRPGPTAMVPLYLALDEGHAGMDLPVRWKASSTAVPGVPEGGFTVTLSSELVQPGALLPLPED
jgi:biopolymer transport protein ExbB/TolQ